MVDTYPISFFEEAIWEGTEGMIHWDTHMYIVIVSTLYRGGNKVLAFSGQSGI